MLTLFLRSLDVILANKMYESADNGGGEKKENKTMSRDGEGLTLHDFMIYDAIYA